jgi:hypothetical protein
MMVQATPEVGTATQASAMSHGGLQVQPLHVSHDPF